MRRSLVALGLVALVASACSSVTRPVGGGEALSTQALSTQGGGTSGSGGAVGTGGSGNAALTNGGGAISGTGPSGTGPGSGGADSGEAGALGTGTGAGGGPSTGGPGGSLTSSLSGPAGGCTTALKIGVSYSPDEAEAERLVGLGSANEDQSANFQESIRSVFQIGANNVNAQGGIAGCKVELVYHDFSVTASDGWDAEAQAECDDFADDQHVFAVYPNVIENRVLASCLAQKHVPLIMGGTSDEMPTSAMFDQWAPYLYYPEGVAVDRLGSFPQLLGNVGFFGAGAKVGILIMDDGTGMDESLAGTWEKWLSGAHIPVASTYTFPWEHSFSDVADGASAMASAILQFHAAGVNRVLATPDGGNAVVLFTDAEASQSYYPHLAVTTYNVPAVLVSQSASSVAGATVESFLESDIVGQTTKPALPADPARAKCLAAYDKVAAADDFDPYFMLDWCDALSFMQSSLAGVTGAPTAEELYTGAEHLGTSFGSVGGYGPTMFGPGHMDGATAVQMLVWDPAIDGFNDAGPLESVP